MKEKIYKNNKKNRKSKKILLSLGSISLLAIIPIAVVSCSETTKTVKSSDIPNKTTEAPKNPKTTIESNDVPKTTDSPKTTESNKKDLEKPVVNNKDPEGPIVKPIIDENIKINEALMSALNTIKHLNTTNLGKTTLPTKIDSNNISQYIVLPKSTNISNYPIDFNLTNINNFDDEQGSVVITLVAKINTSNISQSKVLTVFNFNKNSNIQNNATALDLNQKSKIVVSLTDLAKSTLASSIVLSDISKYLTINSATPDALYKITNIKIPNNVLGTLVVNLQLDYKGIVLNNEFTLNGFKTEVNEVIVPNDLEKLASSKGQLINSSTLVATNLETSGYKELVEQMNLNQNSKIDADLITNINTLLKNTQDYKNITVSVENGTSNIEGKLVISLNGTYKNKPIVNKNVTITNFNKSILENNLDNISINNFELNKNNYFNDFQTESTLKELKTYNQWKQYIQKLEVIKAFKNETYSLLDYFNNEGITKDININYTGDKNITISFKILNSTFESNKWSSKWVEVKNIISNSAFLPKNIEVLNYFIKLATINENIIHKYSPSEFYWKLKEDSQTILSQLFSLNPQVQTTYFSDSDLIWSADNINVDNFNDNQGLVTLTFNLEIGEVDKIGASRTEELKGFKTFDQIFPNDKQQGKVNNVMQLDSEGSTAKRLITTLKNAIKANENISENKDQPTILKTKNYSLIPGVSNLGNFDVIREGQLKWTEANLKNISHLQFLGQDFKNSWNENTHTYGSRKNAIGIENLNLEWDNSSISVYKSSTSYTFFTNITFNLSSFGLNKKINVYYFVTVVNSQVNS